MRIKAVKSAFHKLTEVQNAAASIDAGECVAMKLLRFMNFTSSRYCVNLNGCITRFGCLTHLVVLCNKT